MSLRDFIWATGKDIQDAVAKKAAGSKQLPVQRIIPEASRTRTSGEEEEEAEKVVPALIQKKTRKGERTKVEQDAVVKRQKKERARKIDHEHRIQSVEGTTGEGKDNRVVLPVTPSMEIPEVMTASLNEIEEIGEPLGRRGEDIEQRPYAQDWTIFSGTQLTRPLIRAEWVARALLPAKIAVYAGAQMFDICDIATRAAMLVRFFFSSCDEVSILGNCGDEHHTTAIVCTGRLSESMESGSLAVKNR